MLIRQEHIKINNTVGQALLAKKHYRAGQHGVATATICALLNIECIIFMGATDIQLQAINVDSMKMLGATIITTASKGTLKDAVNEALRYWIDHPESYYLIGSVEDHIHIRGWLHFSIYYK